MTALQSQSTSNPTSIAQAAAVAALTGPQECVHAMAREFLARRDLVVERLRAIPGVQTTKPEGAFYVFPDFSAFFGRRGSGRRGRRRPATWAPTCCGTPASPAFRAKASARPGTSGSRTPRRARCSRRASSRIRDALARLT